MSQERLAAATELSEQTINDIEGCRMWVSDKTISKLTKALHIEAYQLLLPNSDMDEKYFMPLPTAIFRSLQATIKTNIDLQFDKILSAEG
jgi:transcriptional regulator with XRE-family HTH domain